VRKLQDEEKEIASLSQKGNDFSLISRRICHTVG